MMNSPLTRRHFLRSGTSCIALPFFASLGFRRFASAASLPARAKRMVFIGFGWGVTYETWYPDPKQVGTEWTLPDGLKPLARHKPLITVVQNCYHKHSQDGHSGSTFWLTGANRYGVPGKSFSNTVSVDQVAAAHLGRETRFESLTLSGPGDGHGPGLSLAWNRQGKPMAGHASPSAAFHALFSNEKTPIEVRRAALQARQSVLDTVLEDARGLSRRLSREDNDKLAEYFESIRDIETRLGKEGQWMDVPKQQPPAAMRDPGEGMNGEAEVRAMYDLMVAALQTDSARVATYRQPAQRLIDGLGIKLDGHSISHYGEGTRMEASQARDRGMSTLLAHLIDKLKATREPDGSTLFDHTCVVFGSNLRRSHDLDNCPTILTGGGAGIKLGQHMVMSDAKTPLCNVWLTLLQGVGVPAQSFGDSTGVIEKLRA